MSLNYRIGECWIDCRHLRATRHQGTRGRLECSLLTQFSLKGKRRDFPQTPVFRTLKPRGWVWGAEERRRVKHKLPNDLRRGLTSQYIAFYAYEVSALWILRRQNGRNNHCGSLFYFSRRLTSLFSPDTEFLLLIQDFVYC